MILLTTCQKWIFKHQTYYDFVNNLPKVDPTKLISNYSKDMLFKLFFGPINIKHIMILLTSCQKWIFKHQTYYDFVNNLPKVDPTKLISNYSKDMLFKLFFGPIHIKHIMILLTTCQKLILKHQIYYDFVNNLPKVDL